MIRILGRLTIIKIHFLELIGICICRGHFHFRRNRSKCAEFAGRVGRPIGVVLQFEGPGLQPSHRIIDYLIDQILNIYDIFVKKALSNLTHVVLSTESFLIKVYELS